MRKLIATGIIVGAAAACYGLYKLATNRKDIKQNREASSEPDVALSEGIHTADENALNPLVQKKLEEISAFMSTRIGHVIQSYEDGEYCLETQPNANGNAIFVYIGDEITLCFADWHSHFDLDEPYSPLPLDFDMDYDMTFYHVLEGLISNRICAAASYEINIEENKWCGSSLLREDELNDAHLYEVFGANKFITCSFWDGTKSLLYVHLGEMYELESDPFYNILNCYPDCVLEYFLMKSCEVYRGEQSHREALYFAFRNLDVDEDFPLEYDIPKAQASPIDTQEWLAIDHASIRNAGSRLPYVCAFLDPPHGNHVATDNAQGKGACRKADVDDFRAVNAALFPEGTDELEVLEWTTDWSNYFDDGHEWWGASCWSIYDRRMKRYIVILASSTD